MGAQTEGLLYRSLVGAAGLGQVLRKEEEATGAPVEEATGTEEAEVAEALLSEPPPPQGMKAAKWSGMPVDNRPPFISSCNPLVSELTYVVPAARSRIRSLSRSRLSCVIPHAGVHAFFCSILHSQLLQRFWSPE
jgi:hypothetical protein